jgi:hypothetical protein
VGHAEPAAGLAGLLFARAAASQGLSLTLLHLRAVNTYVANALEQQPVKGGVAPALLPKQSGPGPFTSSLPTWGVSAFAFQVGGGCTACPLGVACHAWSALTEACPLLQGTNAHAVLSADASTSLSPGQRASIALQPRWLSTRHYVLPTANLLVGSAAVHMASGPGRLAVFQSELVGASMAFLWDHQVLGKAIFPGEQ